MRGHAEHSFQRFIKLNHPSRFDTKLRTATGYRPKKGAIYRQRHYQLALAVATRRFISPGGGIQPEHCFLTSTAQNLKICYK